MMYIKKIIIMIGFSAMSVQAQVETSADAGVDTTVDTATGLKSWQFIQSGLELQLVQRLPDQTRGFYQGRGFTQQQADEIATQCVFQTIVKNTGSKKTDKAVSISLKTWRIKIINTANKNSAVQGIKLKEEWAEQWAAIKDKDKQVKQSARIAFKWSTFPSEQTFEPGGDYNWGMISFGPAPGERFDLHIFWQANSKTHDKWIKNIQCPEDK